jgi:hypothetical protein
MNKTLEDIFNEDEYLALNQDVAAAVMSGAIPSGRFHFETVGFSEGRAFCSNDFASNAGLKASENFQFNSSSVRSSNYIPIKNDLEYFFDNNQDGPGIWKWLHYFPVYERYLSKFRGKEIHFCEIGIYSGGSLKMWREYFGPQAHIYGVDIEPKCKVYEDDRTKIFIGDQADPVFWKDFRNQVPELDAVLDDGGHVFHQQVTTLEELLPHLNPNGVFMCEDVCGKNNPFAAYVAGMVPALNNSDGLISNEDDNHRRLSCKMNNFQQGISSIGFYPFVTVIERNALNCSELLASKHGSSWQPFLK